MLTNEDYYGVTFYDITAGQVTIRLAIPLSTNLDLTPSRPDEIFVPEEATAVTEEEAKSLYNPTEVRERVCARASYGLTLNVIKPPAYSSSSRLPRRTYRDALVRALMYSLSKESSPQYARVQARSWLIDRRFPLTS